MAKEEKKTEEKTEKPAPRKKEEEINITKYLQLYGSNIHKYTKAYVEQKYHGIMKTKELWESTVKTEMEGKK